MTKSIVVDTNLIFSALLSSSSSIREILFDKSIHFYAPNFIISEVFKHQRKMLKYTKLADEEFFDYFNLIVENIDFVSIDHVSSESRQKAYELCFDVDLKDIPFVSLSIELNAPLWTGDNKLKKGFGKKWI
jgi:predicted nucleic acid-binding protein